MNRRESLQLFGLSCLTIKFPDLSKNLQSSMPVTRTDQKYLDNEIRPGDIITVSIDKSEGTDQTGICTILCENEFHGSTNKSTTAYRLEASQDSFIVPQKMKIISTKIYPASYKITSIKVNGEDITNAVL